MANIKKQLDAFIEEHILNENLEDVVSERFARYSKYIIQDRALPDVRDGLKPVQRRILYGMQQMGLLSTRPYKKSARIVGDVMGKYHPHGDSSIYEAMVRMSQDFKMNVPLIDMHGNNGSIDGDSAAAMRYTETRLSRAAEYLLKDIDKKTVPFVPNFDDSEEEPIIIPAKFPNLLVNGATGISAGYATKIPPHNLREVILATIALIDNPDMTVDDLLLYIKGPDFPTGGIVQGLDGIRQALATGTGKIIIRSKVNVEEISKSQDRIVISEIPYEVNKAELVKTIDNLRIDKKVEDILEIRDETDQTGLRIAIDLKKGADTKTILNYLYKQTEVQVNYNYNMVSIFSNRPILSGVISMLSAYIEHQKDVITNRSNYELDKAQKRSHIVDGLIRMVDVLDEVIKTIRSSSNKAESKHNIQERFGFTELQAEAIVSLQLYRLSSTDVMALIDENKELSKKIKELNHILSNEKALLNIIKEELNDVSSAIGIDRKTMIEEEVEQIKVDHQALISDEKVIIGITKDGYVKRSNVKSYSQSKAIGLKIDDCLLFEKEVSTLDTLLLFTNQGNYIYLPVYKIEEQKWKDIGVYIDNITPIRRDERIVKTIVISNFSTDEMLLLATKNGMMKQTRLHEFEVSRFTKAMRAIKLSKEDELVSVDKGQLSNIVSISKMGYALRFRTDDLPQYGTQAGGVKCASLASEDQVASAFYVNSSDDFVMLSSRGHIIKDIVEELPVYSRNRRGVLVVERQKNNPHYIASSCRLSKNQVKENKPVLLAAMKYSFKTDVNELKYQGNKFGKKVIDTDQYGDALYIDIEKSLNDAYEKELFKFEEQKQKVKPIESKASVVDVDDDIVVLEETFTTDKKKIRISRLDLFDE